MTNKDLINQNQIVRNSIGKLSQHLQQINGSIKKERRSKLLKTKDHTKIPWKIICHQLNKLEEIDQFIEIYNLPKLSHEEL